MRTGRSAREPPTTTATIDSAPNDAELPKNTCPGGRRPGDCRALSSPPIAASPSHKLPRKRSNATTTTRLMSALVRRERESSAEFAAESRASQLLAVSLSLRPTMQIHSSRRRLCYLRTRALSLAGASELTTTTTTVTSRGAANASAF